MTDTASSSKKRKVVDQLTKPMDEWAKRVVTLTMIFFLIASCYQIYNLQSKIEHAPKLTLQFPAKAGDSASLQQWEALAQLEAHVLQRRYHQANVLLMARVWTVYLGFITGMIFGMVGASFILARIKEDMTEITGEGQGWKGRVASNSPGLVMAVLGTLLMLVTLLSHHSIDVKDAPTYLSMGVVAPSGQQAKKSPPTDLIEAGKSLLEGLAADTTSSDEGIR